MQNHKPKVQHLENNIRSTKSYHLFDCQLLLSSKLLKPLILPLFLLASFSPIFSNTTITITRTLDWQDDPIIHNPTGNLETKIWFFDGASYSDTHPSLPLFSERVPVSSHGKASARIVNAVYESLAKDSSKEDTHLSENIILNTKVFKDRTDHFLYYNLIPIRKTGPGSFERLLSFDIILDFEAIPLSTQRNDYTYTSELFDGEIFKIAVYETGVYKIDYLFLKDSLGIDIDNINPDKIRILGQGGGMLPESIDVERYDDLEELAIQVIGDEDNQFNGDDYVLFYAEGPDKWYYNNTNQEYNRPINIYTNQNYYFIKIGTANGLRISNQPTLTSTDHSTSEYDDYQRFEEETFNLLNDFQDAQGSGRHWYGDPFNPTRERSR